MKKQGLPHNDPAWKAFETSSVLDKLAFLTVADYAVDCAIRGIPIDETFLVNLSKNVQEQENALKSSGIGMF